MRRALISPFSYVFFLKKIISSAFGKSPLKQIKWQNTKKNTCLHLVIYGKFKLNKGGSKNER